MPYHLQWSSYTTDVGKLVTPHLEVYILIGYVGSLWFRPQQEIEENCGGGQAWLINFVRLLQFHFMIRLQIEYIQAERLALFGWTNSNKGATMPIREIQAQVKLNTGIGQSSCSAWMVQSTLASIIAHTSCMLMD